MDTRQAPAAGNVTGTTPEPRGRCWAEIDLGALEGNLNHIRRALPPNLRYVAVVKADAYGHGLHPTASRLMQAGVDLFAVANAAEGASLRELGGNWPVLLLGPVLPEEEKSLLHHRFIATISSRDEAVRLGRAAAGGTPIEVHLKIDTGMGRLGVWWEEAGPVLAAIEAAPGLRLGGTYTHFSDAGTDPAFTAVQRERFLATLSRLGLDRRPGLLIHADNSAGIESLDRSSPFNAVRVGLLQFGVTQYPDSLFRQVPIEPVFSFHTRVGLVKEVPEGTPVSYGRTFRTTRRTRLAVLTAGYGDGIPTMASNRGRVLIRGKDCPILGRVTMDQTIVDATDLAEVRAGDVATIIGRQGPLRIDVAEFARAAGTIPWEVFCSVTKRVPRHYLTNRG